jgi:hypothetical protein
LQVLRIAALILASTAGAITASASAAPTQPDAAVHAAKPAARVESVKSESSSDSLLSNTPWWEKVTVTVSGDGKPESCRYESSLKAASEDCDVGTSAAAMSQASSASSKGEVTRITFERRFTPGASPVKADMQVGDTLLGGQMMALAIDGRGAVRNCKIVATSGDLQPGYGCDEASAERFQASAARGPEHSGYMTILVYGHSEHMV